jgi:hypothetical protein
VQTELAEIVAEIVDESLAAAREAGTYTEVMARWTTAQELRDNGVSVTDALAELAAA